MNSLKRISFNYEVQGKVLHYSCRDVKELENVTLKDNILAPKKNTIVLYPRYKGFTFQKNPKTVEELIWFIESGKVPLVRHVQKEYSTNDYIRKGIYSFDDVFPYIVDVDEKKDFIRTYDNEPVSMNNAKYHVFKKNTTCVCCGLKGEYLALEQCKSKDDESLFHFNMYGIIDGKEVLFTKDHIIPKSKGGTNTLDNYQTMCVRCNAEKGNRDISLKQLHREIVKMELPVFK